MIIPVTSLILFSAIFVIISVISCHSGIFAGVSSSDIVKDLPVIIIDPGHGGVDGGAVSSSGIAEKDINLNIAKYICDFCSISGLESILTRNDDSMLISDSVGSLNRKRSDLKARVELASSYDNAIFVSIHQNKFENSRYTGLQVFYSKNNPESYELASIIKDTNRELIDNSNNREIKPSGREIYVLDNIDSPAVLIECGFLSNSNEARKLNSSDYQMKLAFMIYSALMKFVY